MSDMRDGNGSSRLGKAEASPLSVIARTESVESILQVCLKVTGMGYGVVAHVTDDQWLACAVRDQIGFGLAVGGELPLLTTICHEVRQIQAPIAFDHASIDPRWRDHHTPRTYKLESYIAVPIVLSDGELFGTLCAIDPRPAPASAPETVQMFQLFAQLIAAQIDSVKRVQRSEAALIAAQETAVFRDQFIAVLGHDLRNPLAAVDGLAALLEKKLEGTNLQRFAIEIQRSAGRMARLISDVLDFARGRLGGGMTATRRPADLAPVIEQIAGEFSAAYPGRSLQIDIALESPVSCDPDRIGQLASNLLGNAFAHGDPDGPVRLQASTTDAAFVLSVMNGGKPIPPHIKARLFQPFSRRHTGEMSDGLGLGLYICSQIAAAHEGDLTASSIPGETCFEFRMPLGD